MNFHSLLLLAASKAPAASAATSGASQPEVNPFLAFMAGPFGMIIMMVLLFGLMYFIMIRPQKKKEKETAKMRSNLQIGDEVTTIGGVVGIVVSLREDTVVIETGTDRSKMRFQRWAIQSNNTIHEES